MGRGKFRVMSVFKNGKFYHFEFMLDGRRRRGSTGTANKQQAIAEERRQRERLEKSYTQVIEKEAHEQQRKTIQLAADEFLKDYRAKHQSPTFAEYALRHVSRLLGGSLVVEITPNVVKRYQADRLNENAGPKTINDEVQLIILRRRTLLGARPQPARASDRRLRNAGRIKKQRRYRHGSGQRARVLLLFGNHCR